MNETYRVIIPIDINKLPIFIDRKTNRVYSFDGFWFKLSGVEFSQNSLPGLCEIEVINFKEGFYEFKVHRSIEVKIGV